MTLSVRYHSDHELFGSYWVNRQLIIVVLTVTLSFSLGGCKGILTTGIKNSDTAINTVDDIVRRTNVPETALYSSTKESQSISYTFTNAVDKPILTTNNVDLLHEGGCAILDFRLDVGRYPTDGEIALWVLKQGVEMSISDRDLLRQKLRSLAQKLDEHEAGAATTDDVAKAWLDVGCAVSVGE
jgi:uncharacterized membrane protein